MIRSTKISIAFLLLFGVVSLATATNFKKIKYTVKQVENTWFVVNDDNGRPVAIDAERNDDIEWTAEGSDMVFQFPVELSELFTKENGEPVDDDYIIRVQDGKKLKLKVKNNAPKGEYIYSVYVTASETYAEGSSPPVMIIR